LPIVEDRILTVLLMTLSCDLCECGHDSRCVFMRAYATLRVKRGFIPLRTTYSWMKWGNECTEYARIRDEIRHYMFQLITYLPEEATLQYKLRDTPIALDMFTMLYQQQRVKENQISQSVTNT
jgi:hypothetical protein